MGRLATITGQRVTMAEVGPSRSGVAPGDGGDTPPLHGTHTAEFDRFEQATAALLVNGDWGSMAIEADVSPSIEPVSAGGA